MPLRELEHYSGEKLLGRLVYYELGVGSCSDERKTLAGQAYPIDHRRGLENRKRPPLARSIAEIRSEENLGTAQREKHIDDSRNTRKLGIDRSSIREKWDLGPPRVDPYSHRNRRRKRRIADSFEGSRTHVGRIERDIRTRGRVLCSGNRKKSRTRGHRRSRRRK